MTMKVFLQYLPDGKVTGQVCEEEIYFEQRKSNGELVLEIPSQINYKNHKIDITTMTVLPKTQEEIDADTPKPIDHQSLILQPITQLTQSGSI